MPLGWIARKRGWMMASCDGTSLVTKLWMKRLFSARRAGRWSLMPAFSALPARRAWRKLLLLRGLGMRAPDGRGEDLVRDVEVPDRRTFLEVREGLREVVQALEGLAGQAET